MFGEHAVVHGVTAIAATLSDLRIYADIGVTEDPSLTVYLHDFTEEGPQQDPYVVTYSTVIASLGENLANRKASPKTPINPTEDFLEPLRKEFEAYPTHSAHGLMAITYMVAMLLPNL